MALDLTPALADRLAARFAALGDPVRLRLLRRLMDGPCTVGDLVRDCAVGQPSASKHLQTLRAAGFVSVRRSGTSAWYAICDPDLGALCETVCGGLRRHIAAEQEELGGT
ncbi:MAG: hypothetical protein RLZZ127_2340 [Planctomycetota bacterium]|jgi:ArsR family transcriptional regulator